MMAWYEDIKALTEKTPEERTQFVRTHSRSLSRSSRRSVSSDGLMDEDDDEPFSASSQIDVNPGPKQEAISRRSQPGGRFPSDIQVNAQRGLQAPHSPSSVSSGRPEPAEDARVDPVSGVLPAVAFAAGSHEPQGYDQHMGYGGTARTPMDEMPSHAAIATEDAQQDGVNPYTSEPVQQSQAPTHAEREYFVAPVVVNQTSRDEHDNLINESERPNNTGFQHNHDQPKPKIE